MSKLQPTGTRQVGIHFGDNDFYYTCMAFMRTLLPDETYTHHMANSLTFTKAKIVELFNGMAYPLYLLKQNAWRYPPGPNIQKYLQITEAQVYLDDEVKQFADNTCTHNGDFFVVDFTEAYLWSM